RHFRDQGALRQDGVGKVGVFARIDMVVAAREHGDGAGGEARAMGGGVDAAREAGDDGKARGAEIARQPLGETQPRGRGMGRAGRWSTAVWPRTARSGGASSIICNGGG